MSDWELDSSPNNEIKTQESDWMIEQPKITPEKENLSFSALMALPRIGEDIYRGGAHLINNLPRYAYEASTAIPQALQTIKNNPKQALSQAGAGLAELGQNTFNLPHDVTNYLTNRLNLFPKNINEKIQMARMPENTQQLINQQFGTPENQGEGLIRGIPRNLLNILGAQGAASVLNPLRYRNSNIAKNIIGTRNALKKTYTKKYNNIFNKAEDNALGSELKNIVPELNLETATFNEPELKIKSIQDFINNPTTRTAHDANKELKRMQRKLLKSSERETLGGGEIEKLKAINNAIPKIEENMFKDIYGNINKKIANRYRTTSSGYGKEVIPYTTNPSINAFSKGEKLPRELVNSLGKGKFAAQRGKFHPEIGRRNFINHIAPWAAGGIMGSAGFYALNKLLENLKGIPTNQNQ